MVVLQDENTIFLCHMLPQHYWTHLDIMCCRSFFSLHNFWRLETPMWYFIWDPEVWFLGSKHHSMAFCLNKQANHNCFEITIRVTPRAVALQNHWSHVAAAQMSESSGSAFVLAECGSWQPEWSYTGNEKSWL